MSEFREIKKRMTLEISKENHKQLKVFAANNEISMREFIEGSIHIYSDLQAIALKRGITIQKLLDNLKKIKGD